MATRQQKKKKWTGVVRTSTHVNLAKAKRVLCTVTHENEETEVVTSFYSPYKSSNENNDSLKSRLIGTRK